MSKTVKKNQKNKTTPDIFDYVSKKWTDVKESDEIYFLNFHIFSDITEWNPDDFECYSLKIIKLKKYYDSENPVCTPDKVNGILRSIEFTYQDEDEPDERDAFGAFCVYKCCFDKSTQYTDFLGSKFLTGILDSAIAIGETPWHLYFADKDMASTFFLIFRDNYLRVMKERQQTIRNHRREFKKLCRQILR